VSWLPAVSAGIGGVQSILGLFGANHARQQAEQAAQQAILQFQSNASQAYNNTAQAGQGNLYALSGQLGTQLERQGGALGQALANAGVWNSTAAAGALANQGAANAGALATEQSNLGNSLNQLKSQTGMEAANMQFGLNQNNLNYSRNLYSGSVNGVTSFLSNLGQMTNNSVGGRSANAAGASSGNAQSGGVLPPTAGAVPTNYNLWTGSPQQQGANFGALPGGGY
jgi:hypothetical protein